LSQALATVRLSTAILLLLLSGCRRPTRAPEAAWVSGAQTIKHQGPVPLGHYLGPGHVHGVGRMGPDVIATFDDGVLWVSSPLGTQRFEAGAPFEGQATELWVAQVKGWNVETLNSTITLDGVEARVRQATRSGDSAPFRVEGVASSLGLQAGERTIRRTPVVVVGFLGGAAHLVAPATPLSAVASTGSLAPGARLMTARAD